MLKTDTIIPGLEVPNLDALTDEDLDNACDAFGALERLAYAIRSARRARIGGHISDAIIADKRVDSLHSELPQSMRY